MKVKHIINHLVEKGTWVDWDETRDIILSGTDSLDIEKIGVCWVATNKSFLSFVYRASSIGTRKCKKKKRTSIKQ